MNKTTKFKWRTIGPVRYVLYAGYTVARVNIEIRTNYLRNLFLQIITQNLYYFCKVKGKEFLRNSASNIFVLVILTSTKQKFTPVKPWYLTLSTLSRHPHKFSPSSLFLFTACIFMLSIKITIHPKYIFTRWARRVAGRKESKWLLQFLHSNTI
jgi:hypothetical protein